MSMEWLHEPLRIETGRVLVNEDAPYELIVQGPYSMGVSIILDPDEPDLYSRSWCCEADVRRPVSTNNYVCDACGHDFLKGIYYCHSVFGDEDSTRNWLMAIADASGKFNPLETVFFVDLWRERIEAIAHRAITYRVLEDPEFEDLSEDDVTVRELFEDLYEWGARPLNARA